MNPRAAPARIARAELVRLRPPPSHCPQPLIQSASKSVVGGWTSLRAENGTRMHQTSFSSRLDRERQRDKNDGSSTFFSTLVFSLWLTRIFIFPPLSSYHPCKYVIMFKRFATKLLVDNYCDSDSTARVCEKRSNILLLFKILHIYIFFILSR